MKLSVMLRRMPEDRASARRWSSTSTPAAEAEITAAVDDWLDAVPRRNAILRKHYAAGVEVRDLARICRAAGWAKVHPNYLHRIIAGADTDS